MRPRIVRLLLCAGLLAVLSPVIAMAAAPQNIILIGWDGAEREGVDQALSRKELPNLQRLIDQGVLVKIHGEGVVNADGAWTQVLTGYLPKQAGSGQGQSEAARKGATVFERLKSHFGPDKFVAASVIGRRQAPAGLRPAILEIAEDGLLRDDKVGARAVELLARYRDKPFFLLVRFAQVDSAARTYGSNSRQYSEALISNDQWTGRIVDRLRTLGLADKTQVYVTAGHGPSGADQDLTPPAFLVTDNKAVHRDGRRQDIAPTILEAFGLDLGKIEPPLDGISLTKADTRPPIMVASRQPDVVYVPTPQVVVDKMLEMAQVKQSDIVYDLGCGDGRIVVTAAKRFGCRAFGYDIDPQRVAESLENVEANGVGHLVTIEQRDIFTLDLSGVDVVTLYLLPSLNVKLIPQLEKLKPGSRIVSHDFDMKGVEPDEVVEVRENGNYISHTVYLWTAPLKKTEQPDSDDDGGW
ncbi:alkaline phosphatase family protein [Anaerobaca lacustris]|uniref:Alkaline phosphatase family protein n=1 Tax=Anaerobaca lacustris TaxID=3044600 RepID=A0AAW6TSB3_9BACT|nr:alkaline phosphatase family protein [Sedimentisphaerales bacterium M17dextr]